MTNGFTSYAMVAAGSAAGGCARHAIGEWVSARTGGTLPWGTFVVNVTGCFVVGLFLTAAADRLDLDPRWRLLVAVGFCGGYTTLSALAYETSKLLDARSLALAALNVAGTFVAAIVAVRVGSALAGRIA